MITIATLVSCTSISYIHHEAAVDKIEFIGRNSKGKVGLVQTFTSRWKSGGDQQTLTTTATSVEDAEETLKRHKVAEKKMKEVYPPDAEPQPAPSGG